MFFIQSWSGVDVWLDGKLCGSADVHLSDGIPTVCTWPWETQFCCSAALSDYYRCGTDWRCHLLLFLLVANCAAGIFFLKAVAIGCYLIVYLRNCINQMDLGYVCSVAHSLGLWVQIFHALKSTFLTATITLSVKFLTSAWALVPRSTWPNHFYIIHFFPSRIQSGFLHCDDNMAVKKWYKMGNIKCAVQFVLTVLIFITRFFPSTVSCTVVWIIQIWPDECKYFEDTNLFCMSVCFIYFNGVLKPVLYYFSSCVSVESLRTSWIDCCKGLKKKKKSSGSSDNDISTTDRKRLLIVAVRPISFARIWPIKPIVVRYTMLWLHRNGFCSGKIKIHHLHYLVRFLV